MPHAEGIAQAEAIAPTIEQQPSEPVGANTTGPTSPKKPVATKRRIKRMSLADAVNRIPDSLVAEMKELLRADFREVRRLDEKRKP